MLAKAEPHTHTVPHGDRSAVVIEPFLTDQWYVDAKTLAAPAIAAVRSGRTVFVPRNWEATYFNWMENIQPWCISRQLWWGHQIPAWYGPDGKVFVAESEAEALSDAINHYVANGTISGDAAAEMRRQPSKSTLLTRDEKCSTRGSPPRSGRSRPWVGPTTRRNSSATTRPTRW